MKVLLADDEKSVRVTLGDALDETGHEVARAGTAAQAQGLLEEEDFDCLITDLRLPDADGLGLVRLARERDAKIGVIVITGYGTIEGAVEAMKSGADDYLLKPVLDEDVVLRVARLGERRRMEEEAARLAGENVNLRGQLAALRRELARSGEFEGLVGKSSQMLDLFSMIETVAASDASVLIAGESGTGKELVARAIHARSARADAALVAFSCSAVPETLIEDELFGHERGAFTDARTSKAGRFEVAHRGTIFLDDIDDLALEIQVKLLRVLQEREFTRLGGTKPIKVDVRVIAATKADLAERCREGRFREDLYYRLNVVPLPLPPLRERIEDIPLLVTHFIARHGGGRTYEIAPGTLEALAQHAWPGNVRELENAVARAIAFAPAAGLLDPRHLLPVGAPTADARVSSGVPTASASAAPPIRLSEAVAGAERDAIRRALASTGGSRTEAAKKLGVSRKTLWQKMKTYGIDA